MMGLRPVARRLVRERGFSAVVVLTLALGIGASTVVFTVSNSLLLRPLPYPEPERIVRVQQVDDQGRRYTSMSDPNFFDLKAQSRSFAAFAQYGKAVESLAGGAEPARIGVAYVSSEFFDVLGVQPRFGRTFTAEERQTNGSSAAIVGYGYWQRQLGGTADFANRTLRNGQREYAIVGVMPPGFDYPDGAELWVPTELWAPNPSRTSHNYRSIARLADGVELRQAQAELGAIAARLAVQHGEDTRMADVAIARLHDQLVGGVRPALAVLTAAALLLLLVACANTLSMLLARLARREEEIVLQRALGAERRHLARDLFLEVALLASAGASLGLLAAAWVLNLLRTLGADRLPRAEEIGLDATAALFAYGIALAAAAGLSALTVWRAPTSALLLRAGSRAVGAGPRASLRDGLAAGQVAIAFVLIVGVLLLGRSFAALTRVDPGFRPENTVLIDIATTWSSAPFAERADLVRFYADVLDGARALPGVAAAGGVSGLPLAGGGPNGTFVEQRFPGELASFDDLLAALRDPARVGQAEYRVASEGYFEAMGIPLLRGRLLDRGDDSAQPIHAAVVSRSLADSRWPGQDPIGKLIQFGGMDGDLTPFRVVGVVGDVRDYGLDSPPRQTFYAHYRQRSRQISAFWIAVRAADARSLIPALRDVVQRANPDVPPGMVTGENLLGDSLAPRRFNLIMLALVGGAAVLIALAGVYGAVTFDVARRRHEIGLRMALGARGGRVTAMVVGRSAILAGVGVGVGLVVAFAASHVLQALLFAVSRHDPTAYASAGAALLMACAAAAWLPAVRAARIDPLQSLRSE